AGDPRAPRPLHRLRTSRPHDGSRHGPRTTLRRPRGRPRDGVAAAEPEGLTLVDRARRPSTSAAPGCYRRRERRSRAMSEPLGDVATRVLFENAWVKVWEMTLAPGETSALHRHDRPYLMCVLEGTRIDATIVDKGNLQIPVQPGSVLFVPPGDTERAI